MTFIVSSGKPPRYRGRFADTAAEEIKNGNKVGMMLVIEHESHSCTCHVCNKSFMSPVIEKGEVDGWKACTHCGRNFIFWTGVNK